MYNHNSNSHIMYSRSSECLVRLELFLKYNFNPNPQTLATFGKESNKWTLALNVIQAIGRETYLIVTIS